MTEWLNWTEGKADNSVVFSNALGHGSLYKLIQLNFSSLEGLISQIHKWSEVAQSCLTLCDPMDSSLSGSSVHGIFQARILVWVAMPFSRESSWPRDQTCVSFVSIWETLGRNWFDGLVPKSYLTLATPWSVCSLLCSSFYGILQARILE